MTTDERSLALSLSPLRVSYPAGSTEKRFAWSMADQAEHGAPPQITDRQAQYLITLGIRMRRQLPADVLATAERLARRPMRCSSHDPALAALRIASAAGRAIERRAAGGTDG
jgi:hypothetical protein